MLNHKKETMKQGKSSHSVRREDANFSSFSFCILIETVKSL